MKVRNVFRDDNGVSPVIGVVLMIAITVTLGAVVSSFVLGLGDEVSETAPQTGFSFTYESSGSGTADFADGSADGNLTIIHAGGPEIPASQLGITGGAGGTVRWDDGSFDPDSEVAVGDSVSYAMNSDETVRVTWINAEGSKSSTLQRFAGPDV